MTYVIGADCIDYTDRSCIEECPVDCIYEGARKLYINPTECIDCGACEPACPVSAISPLHKMTPSRIDFAEDSVRFFDHVLSGRTNPLGNPGGASKTGTIGVDTPNVAGWQVD